MRRLQIIPGDILIIAGHVAIVTTINDANSNGQIEANEIGLIEAAGGSNPNQQNAQRPIWAVMNNQTASSYPNYIFRRFQHNNE
jgi:hypothetical protein